MTEPWEETWRVGQRVPRHIYNGDGPNDIVGMADNEGYARLAACAPEMARMLLDYEYNIHNRCECGNFRGEQHRDDCEWLALMKKAGIR